MGGRAGRQRQDETGRKRKLWERDREKKRDIKIETVRGKEGDIVR